MQSSSHIAVASLTFLDDGIPISAKASNILTALFEWLHMREAMFMTLKASPRRLRGVGHYEFEKSRNTYIYIYI